MWQVNNNNEVFRVCKTWSSKRGYYLVIWDRYESRTEAETVAAALNAAYNN